MPVTRRGGHGIWRAQMRIFEGTRRGAQGGKGSHFPSGKRESEVTLVADFDRWCSCGYGVLRSSIRVHEFGARRGLWARRGGRIGFAAWRDRAPGEIRSVLLCMRECLVSVLVALVRVDGRSFVGQWWCCPFGRQEDPPCASRRSWHHRTARRIPGTLSHNSFSAPQLLLPAHLLTEFQTYLCILIALTPST